MWNPPTSSCSASTRSNGGRLSSAVPAMRKMTNGTKPVATMFQLRMASWTARRCRGSTSVPADEHDGDDREPERRFVAHHLGRRPHRAEQRVLRARRPAGQHHAVDRDRAHRQHQQDADRRVGQLHERAVAEDDNVPSDPSVQEPPIGMIGERQNAGTSDRYGASWNTKRSARSGIRSSLKKSLMPSARVWRMPHGPARPGRSGSACRR